MDVHLDDLDYNPFYRALQTTYAKKFEEAEEKCWLICIPHSKSLKCVSFTEKFVENHLLKPSPFFKCHFVSSDKNETKKVELDGRELRTLSGVHVEDTIKILSEETGYNKHFRPYRILIVEKPLDCTVTNVHDAADATKPYRIRISFNECKEFLERFSCHEEAMSKLNKKLNYFNNNYMVLPKYLHDAACRLKKMTEGATESFLNSHTPPLDQFEPLSVEIASAVESYVLGYVHSKVFSVVKQKCAEEDAQLSELLHELYSLQLTPDQLGVKEAFCCPLKSPVVELASINSKNTPAEKLQCLITTLEAIYQEIRHSIEESLGPLHPSPEVPNITSDDLIPILVTILVQARPQYLESNLFYMQNYSWKTSSIEKSFSYCLVTFQAAKEYLKSSDFSHLNPSKTKIKKEISLVELMEVTAEVNKNLQRKSSPSHNTASSCTRTTSPIDRELERITQMIEASTRDLDCQPNIGLTPRRNGDYGRRPMPKEGLGEFFTNLQQNCLGVSYGKQT